MKKVFAALRKGDNKWVVKPKAKNQGWRGIWCSGWMRRHAQKVADFNPVTMTADLDPEPLEVRATNFLLLHKQLPHTQLTPHVCRHDI